MKKMKKFIIVTMIAACAALCAAVWPHDNAIEETPVPAAETAVNAKEATVAEIEEPTTLAEKEKGTWRRNQPVPSASTSSGNSVCSSEKSVWNCHSLSGARFLSSGILHQAQSAWRA